MAQPDEMLGWERLDCWDHPLVVMRITMKRRVKNHTGELQPPSDSGKMLNRSADVVFIASLTIKTVFRCFIEAQNLNSVRGGILQDREGDLPAR